MEMRVSPGLGLELCACAHGTLSPIANPCPTLPTLRAMASCNQASQTGSCQYRNVDIQLQDKRSFRDISSCSSRELVIFTRGMGLSSGAEAGQALRPIASFSARRSVDMYRGRGGWQGLPAVTLGESYYYGEEMVLRGMEGSNLLATAPRFLSIFKPVLRPPFLALPAHPSYISWRSHGVPHRRNADRRDA